MDMNMKHALEVYAEGKLIFYDDGNWLDVTMGAWEMQLPQERDESTYPEVLCYRTSFNADHLPDNLCLLIDGFSGSSWRLFINGYEVKDKGQRAKLDAEMKEINISSYLKTGSNTVAVQLVAERRTDGILDLLKIIGDFALSENNDEYKKMRSYYDPSYPKRICTNCTEEIEEGQVYYFNCQHLEL